MISGENLLELALPCKSGPLHIELDLANVTDLFGLRLLAVQVLKSNVALRIGLHVRKGRTDWERAGA